MTNRSYPYVCIECGVREERNSRFFPLDELLSAFRVRSNGGNNVQECLKKLLGGFQVGAMFGDKVLEYPVPTRAEDSQADVVLSDDRIMAPVCLSMYGVLRMLEKQLHLESGTLDILVCEVPDSGDFNRHLQDIANEPSEDERSKYVLHLYEMLENALSPYLQDELGNTDVRRSQCVQVVETLRMLVEIDPSMEIDEIAENLIYNSEKAEVVYAAWTYTTDPLSHVDVPVGLSIFDPKDPHDNKVHKCTKSCCPYCHRPMPRKFGAYRQVIVGVLGGQSAGKTTYLAALADSLSQDLAMNQIPFSILRGDKDDPQWSRFCAEPSKSKDGQQNSMGGPLWMYRNGYRVQKTELRKADAASLTFCVRPEKGEPLLYVFADIAGEAFTGNRDVTARQVAQRQKPLLNSCDALFMIFSSDSNDYKSEKGENEIDTSEYINWMNEFMGGSSLEVPAALLLTKADKMFNGLPGSDSEILVRKNLLYRLHRWERTLPVVDKQYNVEAMSSLCRLTLSCADNMAPGLTGGLRGMLHAAAGGSGSKIKMAAFPVCTGTDAYVEIGAEQASEEACMARYRAAKAARYGIQAPLMWLLALQGVLPAGRGKSSVLQYDEATNQRLQEQLQRELHCPSDALRSGSDV